MALELSWEVLIQTVKSDQTEGIPGSGIPEQAVSKTDYRPCPPSSRQSPHPRFIFVLSQSPRTRLSWSLEQVKENYTDLADTPFPFS